MLYVVSSVMGFYYLGFYDGWTWIHTIHAFRCLFVPSFALLAWFGWSYSKSIYDLSRDGMNGLEKMAERQACYWLAVALMIFLFIAGLGLSFSAAYIG